MMIRWNQLDWSAESQVLIPAEHLWCDFKCKPWAKNSSPNTNHLYIHYMDKSTETPPSLEEKKALPNCGNKDIHVLKNCISTSVETALKCMKWLYHMYKSLVFSDELLAQGLHLKSHQRCSAKIRTWLSAEQSRSSTLTESSFLFDPCLIHRCHVRIEKGPDQTVAKQLKAHNSLEYHYMLKHWDLYSWKWLK